MTPDRAAIDAVTRRLRELAKTGCPCDPETVAAVAVTTLQGLGWKAPTLPLLPPSRDASFAEILDYLTRQVAAMPEATQVDFALAPPPAREEP